MADDLEEIELSGVRSTPSMPVQEDDASATGEDTSAVQTQQEHTAVFAPVKQQASAEQNQQQQNGSTMLGASSNFINSIIGAGIIGLPFAMQEAGIVLGTILLLGIALATYFGVTLIIRLGVLLHEKDYESLAGRVFGNYGWATVNIANALFGYGACCAYLIIMTDTLSTVVAHWAIGDNEDPPSWLRRAILGGVALVVVLPLSMVGNMSTLSWSSGISLAAVAWILAFTIARLATGAGEADSASDAQGDSDGVVLIGKDALPSIGVFAFAYVCHHNSFLVFHSLDEPSLDLWRHTARLSLVVAFLASICLGVVGYVTFGGDTMANVLNNYRDSDEWANLTRVGYAATMILTYPMEVFVVRHCIGSLFGLYMEVEADEGGSQPSLVDDESSASASPSPAAQDIESSQVATIEQAVRTKLELSMWSHVAVSLLIWASTVGIAMVVEDLGIVLELTGGVSATIIGFIMPGALRLVIWRSEDAPTSCTSVLQEILPSAALMLFGVFSLFATTTTSILNAID